jgi:hypothetical protein
MKFNNEQNYAFFRRKGSERMENLLLSRHLIEMFRLVDVICISC